jgi:hypothetical protein
MSIHVRKVRVFEAAVDFVSDVPEPNTAGTAVKASRTARNATVNFFIFTLL